jgi:hypothetical protein
MQDFQEVIEDSQLINAMYDDTPKPVEEWFRATPEQHHAYEERVSERGSEEGGAAGLAGVCGTSLGFYLVSECV